MVRPIRMPITAARIADARLMTRTITCRPKVSALNVDCGVTRTYRQGLLRMRTV
jgi:hypothetical protein